MTEKFIVTLLGYIDDDKEPRIYRHVIDIYPTPEVMKDLFDKSGLSNAEFSVEKKTYFTKD